MENAYTTKQVARMLRVSEETVRRWVRQGILKGELNNGKRGGFSIRESVLNDYLKERPKYRKTILTDSERRTHAAISLTQRIVELERLICNLQKNLEELKELRDLLE